MSSETTTTPWLVGYGMTFVTQALSLMALASIVLKFPQREHRHFGRQGCWELELLAEFAFYTTTLYYFLAFVALLPSAEQRLLLKLRDATFRIAIFPASLAVSVLHVAGMSDVQAAPAAQGYDEFLFQNRLTVLALAFLVEATFVFHSWSAQVSWVDPPVVGAIAATLTIWALFFQTQTSSTLEFPRFGFVWLAVSAVGWFLGMGYTELIWEVVEPASTPPKAVSAVSRRVVPVASGGLMSAEEDNGDDGDDDKDEEVSFNPSSIKKAHATLARRPLSSRKGSAASKTAAKTSKTSKATATKSKKATTKTTKTTITSSKKQTTKRQSLMSDEDDDDDVAVAFEQAQVPKELRFESPGVKNPIRGRPLSRLRSGSRRR
eukprot:m.99992 g.99992  ORF g.99992 m.99992 type:complete len:377 (-) comp15368_c1_seq2:114-1244(-)